MRRAHRSVLVLALCSLPVLQAEQMPLQPTLTPVGAPSLVEKGERHAGNNFLQAVLNANFGNATEHAGCNMDSVESLKYYCCWTHGYAHDTCATAYDPPLTALALLVRNPYSWLVAMYTEPYEHESVGLFHNFSAFLRDPFTYTPGMYRDNNLATAAADSQPSAVELWTAKVDSYLNLRDTPHVILTHLDLYDEDALTRKLAPLTSQGGYFPPGAPERIQMASLLAEGYVNDKMSGQFSRETFNAARDYESSKEWLSHYSADDLAYVNGLVGEDRMQKLGFQLETQSPGAVQPVPHVPFIRNTRLHGMQELATPGGTSARIAPSEEERALLLLLDDPRWSESYVRP